MRRTCLHCPGSSRTDELVENTAQDGLRRGQKSIEISHAPRRTILDQCVGSGRSRAVWISRLHVLHASLYVLGQILSPTISRDLPRSPAISHFEISGRSREIEPAISPTCDVIHQKLRLSANFLKSIACRGRRGSGRELCSFAIFATARIGRLAEVETNDSLRLAHQQNIQHPPRSIGCALRP